MVREQNKSAHNEQQTGGVTPSIFTHWLVMRSCYHRHVTAWAIWAKGNFLLIKCYKLCVCYVIYCVICQLLSNQWLPGNVLQYTTSIVATNNAHTMSHQIRFQFCVSKLASYLYKNSVCSCVMQLGGGYCVSSWKHVLCRKGHRGVPLLMASVLTPDSQWIAMTTGLSFPRVTNTGPPEEHPSILIWYAMCSVCLSAKDSDCVHKLKRPNPPIMRHTMLHMQFQMMIE